MIGYSDTSFLGTIPGACWVDAHGNVLHTDHCTGHLDWAAMTRDAIKVCKPLGLRGP
ncbi:hypothetical protein LX12_004349 [Williamsia serinedens]|uniref:Uncharacterized protein n=1 Tax=Williamsia serinedens TaxID=391736 RepID=A0ABT1H893_9NOCA|nr:hypothetical protein [Williamsia serinedens]